MSDIQDSLDTVKGIDIRLTGEGRTIHPKYNYTVILQPGFGSNTHALLIQKFSIQLS